MRGSPSASSIGKSKNKKKQQWPEKALIHIVKEGDRLDLLAYTYYGDPTKFWLICDANQAMFPPDLLVPGKRIIIPKEGL